MPDYPLRHLSLRVPWHDSGWSGLVCRAPHLNGSCTRLKRIADQKQEEAERAVAGMTLDVLPRDQWPCCVEERGAFMAPFEMTQVKRHALARNDPEHYGHFMETPQRYPAYSAGAIPYRWMMRENFEALANQFELDIDLAREPALSYQTRWLHEGSNQEELLECFAGHLKAEASLCLFYAKHVPFVEGAGRILIGVGRLLSMSSLTEYRQAGNGMRGMVWERPVQHSLRPKGKDGLLLPYYQVLKCLEDDPSIDASAYAAHAPSEHWDEFSYGSELVTHDGAISALLAIDAALVRMQADLGIESGWQRQWVHDELVRLWNVRGPYPGLGAVLRAFGLSRGLFVAHALQQQAGENTDPWPLVDAAFRDPASVLPPDLQRDMREAAITWNGLPERRRQVLRILSRFELNVKQAEVLYDENARERRRWGATDAEIIANPYRIYEVSRLDPEGVQLLTVDRGVYPDDVVRVRNPLPVPSQPESAIDPRRVRAFAVACLESDASQGHTLALAGDLAEEIRALAVRPECPVTTDSLTANAPSFEPEIILLESDERPALQLSRYRDTGKLIRDHVLGRVQGRRHSIQVDWTSLVEAKFDGVISDDGEIRARQEKAAALAELAEARFSVLAGPAGAGKTTVLGILCDQRAIRDDGLLLLAPTGKARVRMQSLAGGAGTGALTVAQFLYQNGRYDVRTGCYHPSERPKASGFGTVIVDEASMLTEEMLAALLDALQGVKRLILVGDPAQLPPIGAGRPFVDIIAKLRPEDYESRFPRVAPGYAELTIERRQVGADRPDLRLARWFSMSSPTAGEDDVFNADGEDLGCVRFVEWAQPDDFRTRLIEVLAEELQLSDCGDVRGFNRALGANVSGQYDYFNPSRGGDAGAVTRVEAWQILSPLRGMPFGVGDINRQIHETFRAGFLDLATKQRNRQIPKPLGAERIVYGDKVINLSNHKRDGSRVYPRDGALGYLANGEIGIAVGLWRTRNMSGPPGILKVEFSSQPGFQYDFYGSDFREEGDAKLELAYALTVHKAQGSQFGLVILVLPESHPILSRELVYTALTRHQDRVVVMHQGPRARLKDLAAPHRSETARRRTNLVAPCRMMEFPQARGSLFLQEGLIHRSSKGLAVRSKSELLLAEALYVAGISFEYEKPLVMGGETRYPDFTIEDEISGRTVYWEHLGMLDRPDYRQAWDRKLTWYRRNGILPWQENTEADALLVWTSDTPRAGLDMGEVSTLIRTTLRS